MKTATAIRLHRIPVLLGVVFITASLMMSPATFSQTIKAVQGEPIDGIVALIEEDVILRSELDLEVANIVKRIRDRGDAMPPRDMLERQVLENLINQELQVQRALQTGIRISDADIDQRLVALADQNGLTVAQLRQIIEKEGRDFGEWRRNIGEQILTERLRQRIASGMDAITETEINILLASEDLSGGEYHLSHIMMNLPDGATPDQIRAKQAEVDDVYRRLLEGLDFASAAISYSNDETALDGGEVGWRDLHSIPAFFADNIRDLRAGEFTKPVRSPGGFHILKVNDYREQRQVVVKEFNARHIMIEINELMTARNAMDEISRIKKRLDSGEDFAALAKQYSDDPTTANIGGDMGWFPPEAYGERVALTLQGLKVDDTSEPFQTIAGWHIMELLGTREIDRTEEAIRQEARNQIMAQKAEQEIKKTLRQFRDEAFVEIKLADA